MSRRRYLLPAALLAGAFTLEAADLTGKWQFV